MDFVFQDMNFELDVGPLSAFKFLETLDLNFYDNHRLILVTLRSLIEIFRNQLLTDILLSCGRQIKKLIFNVCADYRSVVDCHNIIAR